MLRRVALILDKRKTLNCFGLRLGLSVMLLFFLGSADLLADTVTNRIEFENVQGLRTVSTQHFDILYRSRFEWAVEDIASEAEAAYSKLNAIIGNFPNQKIALHVVDSADGPINQTLTAPQPFIRIWVAPPSDSNGYGHLRLSKRFKLLIAHELVHVVMGSWHDLSGSIFGQVRANLVEPSTFPFALLTQSKRFAPLWFHEGAAVFLETWLTGGHGRIVGNLDEAYFRTLSLHKAKTLNWRTIDIETVDEAFNVNGAYFYGARFMSWLATEHGSNNVIRWFREFQGASLTVPFGTNYKRIFGHTLDEAWHDFFIKEYRFQDKNIEHITKNNPQKTITEIGSITGLVSKTYSDPDSGDVFFIEIPLHALPRLVRFNPTTGEKDILARGKIGGPAFVNVSVTAFDHERGLFFFSQDTASGWRDLYQIDVTDGKVSKIANNLRQTNLTVDPKTGDLWGTVLFRGESHVARLKRPFASAELFAKLPHNVSIRDLTFSPDGSLIAGVLQNHAETSLVLIDPKILATGSLSFRSVSTVEAPENPTWSLDSKLVYFSSYANGISNVFRHQLHTGKTIAVSNVVDGLYKPTVLVNYKAEAENQHFVLAFQLLGRNGFQPAIIPADEEYKLTDIHYLGEDVIKSFSDISNSGVTFADNTASKDIALEPQTFQYKGINNLRLNALVPSFGQTNTGETAFGAYAQVSDILNHHVINLGVSTNNNFDDLYWNFNYRYKDTYTFDFSKNQSSLFALVNDNNPTDDGWVARVSRRYWRQLDESGIKLFNLGFGYNDNLENAFLNANYAASNSRRSITSHRGAESGWAFSTRANLFFDVGGSNGTSVDPSGTVELTAGIFDTFIVPHNRVRLNVGIGTSVGADAVGFRIDGFSNRRFESRNSTQYQNSNVLPGLNTDSDDFILARRFARIQVENTFPVIRVYKPFGSHRVDLIDINAFGTVLFSDATSFNDPERDLSRLYSVGMQIDFRLKHFFNLDSTLSVGYANVWDQNLDKYDTHGFVSWKWFSF